MSAVEEKHLLSDAFEFLRESVPTLQKLSHALPTSILTDPEAARQEVSKMHLPNALRNLFIDRQGINRGFNFDAFRKLYSSLEILLSSLNPIKAFAKHGDKEITNILENSFAKLIAFINSNTQNMTVREMAPDIYEIDLRDKLENEPLMTFSIRSGSELYAINFNTKTVDGNADNNFDVSFNYHGSGPLSIRANGAHNYFLVPKKENDKLGGLQTKLFEALKSKVFDRALAEARAKAKTGYDALKTKTGTLTKDEDHKQYLYGCFLGSWD